MSVKGDSLVRRVPHTPIYELSHPETWGFGDLVGVPVDVTNTSNGMLACAGIQNRDKTVRR